MKKFLRSRAGKLTVVAIVLGLILIGLAASYLMWFEGKVKFQDLTVNASAGQVQLQDFYTRYARDWLSDWVTDPATIDFDVMGPRDITLKHWRTQQTVQLTIVDDIAPKLELQNVEMYSDEPLELDRFIAELFDHSQVEARFAEEYTIPADYTPLSITVIATDAVGNETSRSCQASFIWAKDTAVLEYGQELALEQVLYHPERDGYVLSQAQLDAINSAPLGQHELVLELGESRVVCNVTVQDTTAPTVKLKEYYVYIYGRPTVDHFLAEEPTDASGIKEIRLLTELVTTAKGDFPVTIEVEDNAGNITTGETVLHVVTDMIPPVIYGANTTLLVEKHSTPNYLAGISAMDDKDGAVQVTVDASGVNTAKAGIYYITYRAGDSSGNVKTLKRKVEVNHDQEDTRALVASLADGLGNDPEALRTYVRTKIYYSHEWGGSDPVWFGLKNRHGNCYVHATVLKAIFDHKGITSQLIWVTDKSHYWLIIQMADGSWRHIDPTPSDLHSRYSLMTDAQRYSTLSGRNWDRSAWPACE